MECWELEKCTIVGETDAAILVLTSWGDEIWIPLSQVEKIVRSTVKGEDMVRMSNWIARKKGLIS